jgi:predicted ATPase
MLSSVTGANRESTMGTPSEIVGREAELAVVATFLDRAKEAPAGLLLSGPAGIGKSTIWREAQTAAAQRGFRVLLVRGAEAEAKLPFAGLISLLDPVAELVLPPLPEVQSSALAVAMRRTSTADTEPDPLTISIATLGAIRTLAKEGPLLIAIDDLQWLDASSRRALEFAARRLRSETIGWVATARAGQPEPADALAKALAETWLENLELGGLPLVALERLLRDRLGVGFRRPTLLRIQQTSAGNPFFALEVGRALLRRGIRFAPEVLPVPDSIAELLRDRLDSLSSAAAEAVLVIG